MRNAFLSVCIILTVFFILFSLNVLQQSWALSEARSRVNQEPDPAQYCKQESHASFDLGCISAQKGVGTIQMYLSLPTVTLLVAFLLRVFVKKHLSMITLPLVVLLWILLSEGITHLMHIPIIHFNPLEGNYFIVKNSYFDFNGAPELTTVVSIFALFLGAITWLLTPSTRQP